MSEVETNIAPVLCPRCEQSAYTPPGGEWTDAAPFPALSRADNETYICSWCGQAEAMEQFQGLELAQPEDWPVEVQRYRIVEGE